MSGEGNEQANPRVPATPSYTNHPYYQQQQQYYAAMMASGQPMVYAIPDPTQPGGYRWAYAQYPPHMMQYYYSYQQYQMPPTSGSNTTNSGSPSTSMVHATQDPVDVPSSTVSECADTPESPDAPLPPPPAPVALERKTSRGFLKDKSKWRLNRSGSKPSLAIDGIEDGEYLEMPPSPRLGVHKQSFCVSPRHCGSAFLPDEEHRSAFSKTENIHLIDSIRMVAGELSRPTSTGLLERLSELETVMTVDLDVIEQPGADNLFSSSTSVSGLLNPANSKICYLNSVIQMLLPIAPLVQTMSLSLTHLGEGQDACMPWTLAIARSMRLFFAPTSIGSRLSLLTVPGMDMVVTELGGLGSQQDVGEALGIVIEKLHQEWKHRLVTVPWDASVPAHLHEDSIMYKLFRGLKKVGEEYEMFTTIHLAAAPSTNPSSLVDLLDQTFSSSSSEIAYAPPVLCIELSRHLSENQLTTSQTSVPFPGTLELGGRRYNLMGVVVRSGVYANSGHFWVAQRRGNSWSWINDTDVNQIPEISQEDQNDASTNSISKKLNAAHNWCLLIYADPTSRVSIHP
jgi:hypothetical protein